MTEFQQRPRTDYIVVHTSATPPHMDIGRDEIDRWHRDRGWNGIGYHYVIRRDGSIEAGRPLWAVGAHVSGFNRNSIGVCWIGGVDNDMEPQDNRTEAQRVALLTLLQGLLLSFRGAEVVGHRDFPGVQKACPSFDVKSWLDENMPAHFPEEGDTE